MRNELTQSPEDRLDTQPAPNALERMTPTFVWAPDRPARLRVALVGAGTHGKSSLKKTLRAAGHRVVAYASAGALTFQLRGQPAAIDLIILDCGTESDSIVPALELLRAQDEAIAVVLISDGDLEILAEARRLSVEAVLERPVHKVTLLAAVAAASLPAWNELGVSMSA